MVEPRQAGVSSSAFPMMDMHADDVSACIPMHYASGTGDQTRICGAGAVLSGHASVHELHRRCSADPGEIGGHVGIGAFAGTHNGYVRFTSALRVRLRKELEWAVGRGHFFVQFSRSASLVATGLRPAFLALALEYGLPEVRPNVGFAPNSTDLQRSSAQVLMFVARLRPTLGRLRPNSCHNSVRLGRRRQKLRVNSALCRELGRMWADVGPISVKVGAMSTKPRAPRAAEQDLPRTVC